MRLAKLLNLENKVSELPKQPTFIKQKTKLYQKMTKASMARKQGKFNMPSDQLEQTT